MSEKGRLNSSSKQLPQGPRECDFGFSVDRGFVKNILCTTGALNHPPLLYEPACAHRDTGHTGSDHNILPGNLTTKDRLRPCPDSEVVVGVVGVERQEVDVVEEVSKVI